MPLAALKAQLKGFVQSLKDEGVLDHQFDQVQALQDADNPRVQPVVDCRKVDNYVHQLKGSSSSIGAQRIKLACGDFCQVYENNYKERYLWTLNKINLEYRHLRSKFQTIVQVEHILDKEAMVDNEGAGYQESILGFSIKPYTESPPLGRTGHLSASLRRAEHHRGHTEPTGGVRGVAKPDGVGGSQGSQVRSGGGREGFWEYGSRPKGASEGQITQSRWQGIQRSVGLPYKASFGRMASRVFQKQEIAFREKQL
ncbi:hypothetical protein HHK36_005168 [Tetracentron sinense]|uniref:Histidine-containing phosphotransfer protein n=1 Tax=Tetracentron sinense TaxID=13715 RepID=A0A834ZNV7_TETSI|nr:hypothetical protein HHK36_005168 [Tetracentron sinense]